MSGIQMLMMVMGANGASPIWGSHFDGTDASTTINLDVTGGTYTFPAADRTIALTTSRAKFGVSGLALSNGGELGGDDRIDISQLSIGTPIEVSFWFSWLVSGSGYQIGFYIGQSYILLWPQDSLGANTRGVDYSIPGIGTGGNAGVGFYGSANPGFVHLTFNWDGSTYRLFFDGVQRLSWASTTAPIQSGTDKHLTTIVAPSSGAVVWDDLMIHQNPTYIKTANFTPPTSPW